MTEYLRKENSRKPGKTRIFICGLAYMVVMAGIGIFGLVWSGGAAAGCVAAAFLVSLAAVAVIGYPMAWGNDGDLSAPSLYRELEKFTDTVLFEYRCGDGTICFTPNASKRIEIPVLKRALDKYVQLPPAPGECRSFEFRLMAELEDFRWCVCHIRAEYDEAEQPVRLIGKLDDISMLKAREEQLLFQSTRDGLTGVYNKTAFEYKMEEILRNGGRGYLYMIDIDNFKDVNDQYGHPAGDKILVKIGALLREYFRESELESELIGRVGGDEFVVYSESGGAKEKAEKLLKAITEFVPEEGNGVSVSIGIAAGMGAEEYQELFSRADQAMYRAKQEGKNRIACYGE